MIYRFGAAAYIDSAESYGGQLDLVEKYCQKNNLELTWLFSDFINKVCHDDIFDWPKVDDSECDSVLPGLLMLSKKMGPFGFPVVTPSFTHIAPSRGEVEEICQELRLVVFCAKTSQRFNLRSINRFYLDSVVGTEGPNTH